MVAPRPSKIAGFLLWLVLGYGGGLIIGELLRRFLYD